MRVSVTSALLSLLVGLALRAPAAHAACGDGIIDGSETCDDRNRNPGDGCSDSCAVEAHFRCKSVCRRCGDGIVSLDFGEECDDANDNSGDGCSADCLVERGAGWHCSYNKTALKSVCGRCGDGIVDVSTGENCDDKNFANYDGCNDHCKVEQGWRCSYDSSLGHSVCKDQRNIIVNGGFEDLSWASIVGGSFRNYYEVTALPGWDLAHSGNENLIQVTKYWAPASGSASIALVAGGETAISQLVNISKAGAYTLSFSMSRSYFGNDQASDTSAFCGNPEIVVSLAQKDSGRAQLFYRSYTLPATRGDMNWQHNGQTVNLGAVGVYEVLLGLNTAGVLQCGVALDAVSFMGPLKVQEVCGNRRIDPDEMCDDGNKTPGDGCSSICAVEDGWSCSGEPSVCKKLTDRDYLMKLYFATGGPIQWAADCRGGWGTAVSEYTWYGVKPDRDGRVKSIVLAGCGLTGKIPAELGQLQNLQQLGLFGNQLTGEIPKELGQLTKLEVLYLFSNQLTGEIPKELGSLTALKWLNLFRNQLTGSIPKELGQLHHLEKLILWGNQLTVSIPAELGQLQDLQELYLGSNQLTGNIPPELGLLQNLTQFSLGRNQLTGSIPKELGQLKKLEYLYLSDNKLEGSIPSELGQLEKLEYVDLSLNQLTGSIPPELGQLQNLQVLNLGVNQLTGGIPKELGQLENLEDLDLRDNKLEGPVPCELWNLASTLMYLGLSGNLLTGSPQDYGDDEVSEFLDQLCMIDRVYLMKLYNATDGPIKWDARCRGGWGTAASLKDWYNVQMDQEGRVTTIDLGGCGLTGSIPKELGQLQNLKVLSLLGNRLTGSIPPELGQLQNLGELKLWSNKLTGSIPLELGQLQNLRQLELWGNKLTGEIPKELGQLQNLQRLGLGGNLLTGSIPKELGQLERLGYLELSRNTLEGEIPKELGQLPNLVYLYLHNNQLSGSIPPQLGQRQNLQVLSLSQNQLTGQVPCELKSLASTLMYLGLSGNLLTGSPQDYDGFDHVSQFLDQLRCPTDRDHLTKLYNATGGPTKWRALCRVGWGTAAALQDWAGVFTDQEGRVRSIDVSDCGLTGSIPKELGQLDKLYWLDLSGNQLTGGIPKELGQLRYLAGLILGSNQLTGSVPCELKQLAGTLTYFDLSNNRLTGSPGKYYSESAVTQFLTGLTC